MTTAALAKGASISSCICQLRPSLKRPRPKQGPTCSCSQATNRKGPWNACQKLVIATGVAASILINASSVSATNLSIDSGTTFDPSYPLLDLAKVIPEGPEGKLVEDLRSLEQRSQWKLRLLTRNGAEQGPSGEEIKAGWKYDAKTAIVICDPTSPNILQFQAGNDVTQLLKRGFFIELQSRFGNIFYVRDEGEAAAAINTLKAIGECLEKGGCAVVPGLPENQYQLTLITSIFGGFIFGYSTTIQNQGFVQRRFIWPLLFAPLWGSLFISFGIGPIVTRTEDKLPLLQNFGAFLLAAAFVRQSPLFKPSAKDLDLISKEGQKKQDAKDFSED